MTLTARPQALRRALLAALLGSAVLTGVLAGGGCPGPCGGPTRYSRPAASWNFGIDRQPLAINPQPLPPPPERM